MSGMKRHRVYRKLGSNRWIRRFVEAVGDEAAPRHHPLHGRPAVLYRYVYKHGHMSFPKYCSVIAFRSWTCRPDASPALDWGLWPSLLGNAVDVLEISSGDDAAAKLIASHGHRVTATEISRRDARPMACASPRLLERLPKMR